MKNMLMGATALAMVGGASYAGGIDRSGQGVNILFEEGNFAQITFSVINPSVDAVPGGPIAPTPSAFDIAQTYSDFSLGYKHEVNDKLDIAVIYDNPFGAHVDYGLNGNLLSGGMAEVNTNALTGLLQYQLGNGFSVHGGIRLLEVDGIINSALGELDVSSKVDIGGVVGIAYEKPEIALRVALTYNSEISSDLSGTRAERDGSNPDARDLTVDFPESVNLDFQTGVAANTLVFGSIRWVGLAGTNVTTAEEPAPWVNFQDDVTTYNLGIARRINDKLSLALRFGYEEPGTRPTNTALSPSTGSKSIGIAGTYQLDEEVSLSAGITYAKLGDQFLSPSAPFPPGSRYDYQDSDAIGFGVRIGFHF
ncbi:outer membrane protein transport protein [Shimia marina]|uniref:Outer membrane protein transport protein (OMPP1/FadL/TodX) n=1 Tax=Shimia marina TaxID=321267 RepID=A0A0P1ES79_9RHOB|nr:transporter [Shimia marina]CUH53383.1 Outer membrane protein transport protein (OMPP1/FadL/TodX) [Shimia marina]SFD78274.1 Long-chain fatty acid transport protein [Shimia marina]